MESSERTVLSLKEIAKRVRAEIAAQIKAGELPKGLKVSVRTDYYSMGCSLVVKVTAVPETFTIANPLHVQWKADNPHADFWSVPEEARARFSPEGAELLSQLDAIVSRYHDSRGYESGVETLYSENFHKRIDWDWEIERADRERLAAQLAAAKVAPEAPAPATQPEKPRFRVLAICTPVEGATIRPVQANSACNTI